MNDDKMNINLIITLSGIWTKLISILSSCWGWLSVVTFSLLNFLLPLKYMFILLGIIILSDFIAALLAARKRNILITSDKARGTLIKALIYVILISLTFSTETLIGINITHKILFAVASLIELYSLAANLLILKPDMPFLKLFAGLVSQEIAKKTETDPKKIEDFLLNKTEEDVKNDTDKSVSKDDKVNE